MQMKYFWSKLFEQKHLNRNNMKNELKLGTASVKKKNSELKLTFCSHQLVEERLGRYIDEFSLKRFISIHDIFAQELRECPFT